MRDFFGRLADVARLVAALLLVGASLRFTVGAVLIALESTSPLPELVGSPSARPPQASEPVASASASAEPAPSGRPLRVMLSISAGPPRSEVWVNGSRREDRTPLLGEVSCKEGERVKIQVVPDEGAPLVFERRCAPGTIQIE